MKTFFRTSSRLLSAGLASLALLAAGQAKAQNSILYWAPSGSATQGGAGAWNSTASFWDTLPTGGTVGTWPNTFPSTYTADFGGAAGAVTLAASTTIHVNTIAFDTTGYTISGATGANIVLDGTTPTISEVTGGTDIISAILSGTSGLTVTSTTGAGTVVLSAGTDSVTGTLNVLTGILQLNPVNTNTGTYNYTFGPANIASGAELITNGINLGGNSETNLTLGNLSGAGVVRSGGSGILSNLIINETGSTTFSGFIGYAGSGSGSLSNFFKEGSGQLTLTGTMDQFRPMAVNAGSLIFAGSGTLIDSTYANTSGQNPRNARLSLTVNEGAAITVDDTATNVASRLNQINAGFFLSGGTFNVLGSSSAATVETISGSGGAGSGVSGSNSGLIFQSGADTVNMQAGSGQSLSVSFTAGGLTRQAGASVLIEGTQLGASGSAANVATLKFNGAAPSTVNLATGGSSSGITVGILPGIFTDTVISGTDNFGIATYISGTGIAALQSGVQNTGVLTANANIDATSSLSNASTTTTINSLQLDAGGSIDSTSGTLVNASATILSTGTANGITNGVLQSGTGAGGNLELTIYNATSSTLTISSSISGTAGLTKGGNGTTILSVANTGLTGAITVNGGILSVSSDGNLGTSTNVVALNNGGTFQATASMTTARSIVVGGTVASTLSSGDIDAATGVTLNLNGTVSGVGGLSKSGAGTVELSSANTYTGATTITAGTLLLNVSNAVSSTSSVTMAGGNLQLAASVLNGSTTGGILSLTSSSTITFAGSNVLNFGNSSSLAWNGVLSIYDWNGSTDTFAFGTNTTGLTSAQLQDINFYSDNGSTLLGTGAFSGVGGDLTFTAVPEPGMPGLVVCGVALAAGFRFMQRRKVAVR